MSELTKYASLHKNDLKNAGDAIVRFGLPLLGKALAGPQGELIGSAVVALLKEFEDKHEPILKHAAAADSD